MEEAVATAMMGMKLRLYQTVMKVVLSELEDSAPMLDHSQVE